MTIEKGLTNHQISQYDKEGYTAPVDLISVNKAKELRRAVFEHISGKRASERYELTDEFSVGTVIDDLGEKKLEYTSGGESEDLHTFPFLINLWKWDQRFKEVAMDPKIAGMARQLLGAEKVLLMEDNVVVKNPGSKTLPWHQDFSYWPLKDPEAVTVWIALDEIDKSNGGMQIVPGSQVTGEHLPVWFKDGMPFLEKERKLPAVPQDPENEGFNIINYKLSPGQGGFHNSLVWHGSPPNTSSEPRVVFVLRYVSYGSIWLGNSRMPYDDIGCKIGDKLTEEHFPLVECEF